MEFDGPFPDSIFSGRFPASAAYFVGLGIRIDSRYAPRISRAQAPFPLLRGAHRESILGEVELYDGTWDPDEPAVPGDGDLRLPPPPEPGPRRVPYEADPDPTWALSWAMVASVLVLGALKLMYFAMSGAVATMALSVVFVAAHGVFIGIGACWFWPHRYR